MITVNSLSGGKTSSYMSIHFPAQINIFACVCIDYLPAQPKDPAVLKYCLDKLNGNFIASAEHDKTLKVMMQLEQILGKEIIWVRGKSFDQVIDEAGCLPTWARRFCTTELKLMPMFEYIYPRHGITKTQIGFRYDESHRAYFTDKETGSKIKKDKSIISFPRDCNNFGHRLQNWEHDFVYQYKEYPLIDGLVFHYEVRSFFKVNFPDLIFPPDSNCLGCHHKPAWLIKKNYQESPAHLEWFALQEKKKFWTQKEKFHTWHDGRITYDKIFKTDYNDLFTGMEDDLFSPDINSEIFKSCDTGGCTD